MSSSRKRAPSDSICSFTAERTSKACDDRAEAAGGGDRLQPGHAGAEHEHLGGADGAGRGGEHREEARQLLRGDQGGAVAGDGGLRGERVHRLGARDARDGLHGEARDAGLGQGAHRVGGRQRGEEADQHRAARQAADLLGRGRRDLGHDLARVAVAERGAGLLVVGIRVVRPGAGAGLDRDLDAALRPSRSTTSGTSATRRSPLAVSLGTETFIGSPAQGRGRGMLAERLEKRGASGGSLTSCGTPRLDRVPAMRRTLPALVVLLFAAVSGTSAAAAPAAEHRELRPRHLRRRPQGLLRVRARQGGAPRRQGAARARSPPAAAAYVYGLAPVSVNQTTQRFPENAARQHRRAHRPDRPNGRAAQPRHHLHGRPRPALGRRARARRARHRRALLRDPAARRLLQHVRLRRPAHDRHAARQLRDRPARLHGNAAGRSQADPEPNQPGLGARPHAGEGRRRHAGGRRPSMDGYRITALDAWTAGQRTDSAGARRASRRSRRW